MNFGIEDETMEFKKTTGEINEAMQSICAMLNKHGHGIVIFGILPNGEAKGQNVTDSTLRDISRKIYESISPQIVPKIDKRIVDGKEIIEVEVIGNDKPYACKGLYYIRIADEDRILQPYELRQYFEYNKNISWDAMLTDYTFGDVDVESVKVFYNKATACGRLKEGEFEPERLLNKLGLIKEEKLTNAGFLMFSKTKPVVLKMAVFATDEKLTFLDINRISGNIISLIEEANAYIMKNIRWKAEFDKLRRIEIPEIPLASLREIICNSFAHARYNVSTEHEITIHPGMVRIYNPGEFPIGYKPEDFVTSNMPSMERNPLILKTLFLSEDVEAYGSGFKRVFEECAKSNVNIDYSIARHGFSFIFKRELLNKSINEVHEETYSDLSEEEKIVINMIQNEPYISAAKIAININKSERSVQRMLSTLKEKGFIEHIGKTKGYWNVLKYLV